MNSDEKLLDDLYRQSPQDEPPASLDQQILAQAQASNPINKPNRTPWLAAASVVMVVPLIWFLTQNPELTEEASAVEIQPQATLKTETQEEAQTEVPVVSDDEAGLYLDQAPEPAPAMSAPAPVNSMAEIQQVIEEENLAITGQPLSQESLERNRKQLIEELKGKKRRITPGTMSPLMALEYEQFNRYLERGDIELADQLLTEMQANFPDYDYEDMIYQLAEAELNAGGQ